MRSGLIILPIIAYILFTLVFNRGARLKNGSEGFVKAHLVIFSFIAISTELLSLLKGVTFSNVLLTWLLFLVVGVFVSFRHLEKHSFSMAVSKDTIPITNILIGAIALILLTTLTTAIVYPPNTWDSMTYHMPRVLHWINNKSVLFYPTEIARQNYQMPLAEFAILHLQVLTGSDLYANLVQWVSFLALICLGVVVAAELGLNRKLQLISAIIVATLPMGILQASSTQNDLVVSVFLMSFALFMLRLRQGLNTENLLFAAISLGLALLTKGTAYIFGAALGISLALPLLLDQRQKTSEFIKVGAALAMTVMIALALNTGHFWRNHQLYGHPLSTQGDDYRNQDMSLSTLESNLLRNVALHLGTPYEQVNSYQIRFIHDFLGSGLNDPQTTWTGTTFSIPNSRHEDTAGNLIHMLIAMFGTVILFISWIRGRNKELTWYAVSILLGAVIYCWILKWQPWNSRLHTPLFVLAAPLLAFTITSGIAAKRIGYLVCLALIVYCIPFALDNVSRSIVSLEWKNHDRKQLYFQNNHDLASEYYSIMNILQRKNVEEVGLYLGLDDWEYPFWALAGHEDTNGQPTSFRSVGVTDISGTINDDIFLPSYVVATKPIKSWEYVSKYVPIYTSSQFSVLRKIVKAGNSEGHNVNSRFEGKLGEIFTSPLGH